MAENGNELTYESFKIWSDQSLKVFLHVRGKNIEGDHDSLAARAYAAWCDNIEVNPENEHLERTVLEEYRFKLIVNNDVVPDPLLLNEGWKGERDGIKSWPSVYYFDIANLLGMTQSDFLKRLESEYKQGKAFRYFQCEFVREIHYNELDINSAYCLMKSKVVPSHRLNNPPYDVWAIIEKNQPKKPGGKILSAYCTCTAGLLGTCNHVIAMLFRIENAVATGVTNPSKTSELCTWNIPKGKKPDVKPRAIKELVFIKGQYMKGKDSTEKVAENRRALLNFSPFDKRAEKKLSNPSVVRNELFSILRDEISGSCLSECMQGKSFSQSIQSSSTQIPMPQSIIEKKNTFVYNETLPLEENVKIFTNEINVTDDQIKLVEKETREQASSQEWLNQRKGRITASNFYKIYTRMKTLRAKTK